jgi:hypothetical protein
MMKFSVGSAQLKAMRQWEIMTVDLDEFGNIIGVNAASMPEATTSEKSGKVRETCSLS